MKPSKLASLCLLFVPILNSSIGLTAPQGQRRKLLSDFNQMNSLEVAQLFRPTSQEELAEMVRQCPGPFSIRGSGFSMGGQTIVRDGVVIDMGNLNKILNLDRETMPPTITVEAGASWRRIQEAIDQFHLSLKVMQSYNDFSVGGSLSVNVHGRYVGFGPIISSVRSIKVLLADGQIVTASRNERPELFAGVIGGYGGLGVILEATLELAENVKLERRAFSMRDKNTRRLVSRYIKIVEEEVLKDKDAMMTNGDIYPPHYDTIGSISFYRSDKELTNEDRMQAAQSTTLSSLAVQTLAQTQDQIRKYRERIYAPREIQAEQVVWRNWEASYPVSSLDSLKDRMPIVQYIFPWSKRQALLQEYFIPKEHLANFIVTMRNIFTRHHANILNVSIRHVPVNNESLLSWSKVESFALVVYYTQYYYGDAQAKTDEVKNWTREIIDEIVKVGGSFYLPYQVFATKEQFHAMYPRAQEFFTLKRQLDPNNIFRNQLWQAFYNPQEVNEQ